MRFPIIYNYWAIMALDAYESLMWLVGMALAADRIATVWKSIDDALQASGFDTNGSDPFLTGSQPYSSGDFGSGSGSSSGSGSGSGSNSGSDSGTSNYCYFGICNRATIDGIPISNSLNTGKNVKNATIAATAFAGILMCAPLHPLSSTDPR